MVSAGASALAAELELSMRDMAVHFRKLDEGLCKLLEYAPGMHYRPSGIVASFTLNSLYPAIVYLDMCHRLPFRNFEREISILLAYGTSIAMFRHSK